jgi:hypothetical protein
MAGAGVVGVTVRDQRALHRPHRIDEEIAGRTIKSLGSRLKEFVRLHRP